MSIAYDNTSLLVQVAWEAYRRALAQRDEANAYRESHLTGTAEELVVGWIRPSEAASRDATVAVVFAGMAIESFISSVGARKLTRSYFQKYLDKLDVVAKWVIVPQLTGMPSLPREGQLFERLGRLVKDRNSLVHGKYRKLSVGADLRKFAESSCDYIDQANNAISVFDGLVDHLGSSVAGVFREPGSS